MTIKQIISILDQPENKHIHRIYHSKLKWCYITASNGIRLKLDNKMSKRFIYDTIEHLNFINNKYEN